MAGILDFLPLTAPSQNIDDRRNGLDRIDPMLRAPGVASPQRAMQMLMPSGDSPLANLLGFGSIGDPQMMRPQQQAMQNQMWGMQQELGWKPPPPSYPRPPQPQWPMQGPLQFGELLRRMYGL